MHKINVRTQPPQREGDVFIDPGPLRELDDLVAALLRDDDELGALGIAVAPLLNKLPAEYRQGENALHQGNPERWREIIHQAHDLLVKGLKKEPPGA